MPTPSYRIDPQDRNAEDLLFDTLAMLVARFKNGKPMCYDTWETAERNLELARKKREKTS